MRPCNDFNMAAGVGMMCKLSHPFQAGVATLLVFSVPIRMELVSIKR